MSARAQVACVQAYAGFRNFWLISDRKRLVLQQRTTDSLNFLTLPHVQTHGPNNQDFNVCTAFHSDKWLLKSYGNYADLWSCLARLEVADHYSISAYALHSHHSIYAILTTIRCGRSISRRDDDESVDRSGRVARAGSDLNWHLHLRSHVDKGMLSPARRQTWNKASFCEEQQKLIRAPPYKGGLKVELVNKVRGSFPRPWVWASRTKLIIGDVIKGSEPPPVINIDSKIIFLFQPKIKISLSSTAVAESEVKYPTPTL